ncbi:hypothetical protein [Bradyrhizobium sp. SZCCHNRI1009]|uniref:hypothetical protein n=1 Tax=Bradyrhizobium sp. SZCCHNRI1009 TaxID=3057277 RepID=UPI002915EBE8|nr:hypothetical protein [Bradyrhizobium sp. SZCCHNRI1009]
MQENRNSVKTKEEYFSRQDWTRVMPLIPCGNLGFAHGCFGVKTAASWLGHVRGLPVGRLGT